MERIDIKGEKRLVGYHTQEFRQTKALEQPIVCRQKNAWLGIGYYFWTELEFAQYWGEDYKKEKTGYYDIYKAALNVDKCINAVFDEEGYFFLRNKIEETINHFKKINQAVTLEQVNRFLADKIWPELGVDGIIYDDKPRNPHKSDRIYSEIPELYYKKRIQVVLFNLSNIYNFELLLEEQE